MKIVRKGIQKRFLNETKRQTSHCSVCYLTRGQMGHRIIADKESLKISMGNQNT